MAKLVVLDTHDGGMVNDPRDTRVNVQRNIQHFDNHTNPRKLTPYRSFKADAVTESTLDAYKIQMFCEGNNTIWGLGRVGSADNHTQIYQYNFDSKVWTTAEGTSTSSSSVEVYKMFVQYNNYIFGANSSYMWKYGDITSGGSETFTYNFDLNVPTGQGIVHSADNIMYYPVGNKIFLLNGVGGTPASGFVFPSNCTINSICEFGNYLAVMYTLPNNHCYVGLWDRDTTNTALSEKIDWGDGVGQVLEIVEGVLVGISTSGGTEGNGNASNSIQTHIYFKAYEYSYLSSYAGLNTVNIFAELVCKTGNSPAFYNSTSPKQRFNQLFYFLASITLVNGITYTGLWKIFRASSGAMVVSFDQLPQNGAKTPSSMSGFLRYGDYFFIAQVNSADSTNTVWRTNDLAVFAATSEWDTTINQGMEPEDRIEKKKLLAVGALYEPLQSTQSVTVQYRVDGGSWVTIFTETTLNQVRTEPYGYTSGGVAFVDGFEYEFRVQSTGGAEVTALIYKYIPLKTISNS